MKPRPLSTAQAAALGIVAAGQVYYRPYFDNILGIHSRTYDVLRGRGLVRVQDEPENPDARPLSRRHAVTLTAAGRASLSTAPHQPREDS